MKTAQRGRQYRNVSLTGDTCSIYIMEWNRALISPTGCGNEWRSENPVLLLFLNK